MSSSRPHRRASAKEDELEWPTDPHSEQIVFGNAIRDWPARARANLVDQEPPSPTRPVMLPGGSLTEQEYAMLAESAISRELADEALLRHLAHLEGKDIYQRKRGGDCEGVYFPNILPTEPDKLRPSRLKLWTDINLPIMITEGEKKTLSLVALSRHGVETPRWGRLLEWLDANGKQHRWAMPIGLLTTIPILYAFRFTGKVAA